MKLLSAAVRPLIALWGREPIAISGLILAFVNLLIVCSVLHMTVQQIGAVNMFLVAFFAFVARGAVTPIANPRDAEGNPLVPMASWQRPRVEAKPR
jgi:hypothetical protein